jgi:streptogramin lyase
MIRLSFGLISAGIFVAVALPACGPGAGASRAVPRSSQPLTSFINLPPRSGPTGITTAADGTLWFTAFDANVVGKLSTNGANASYPLSGDVSPWAITAGPDGALWFTEYGAGRIERITSDGTMTDYPLTNSSSQPNGITAGPDGAMWFTEQLGEALFGSPRSAPTRSDVLQRADR